MIADNLLGFCCGNGHSERTGRSSTPGPGFGLLGLRNNQLPPRLDPAAVPVGLASARALNGLITRLRDPLNTRAPTLTPPHTFLTTETETAFRIFHFSLALAYALQPPRQSLPPLSRHLELRKKQMSSAQLAEKPS